MSVDINEFFYLMSGARDVYKIIVLSRWAKYGFFSWWPRETSYFGVTEYLYYPIEGLFSLLYDHSVFQIGFAIGVNHSQLIFSVIM
jgi:hypothetical protein